ncbi:MAG: hypothetical protein HC794_03575 [Nitrospiraceae bacterium]|nr:hypothetical protein [Nitrospiraceae bacterium]
MSIDAALLTIAETWKVNIVTGKQIEGTVNGATRKFTYEINFPRVADDHEFIPRLWATRRVGFLLDEIRLRGENKELKDEVVELARLRIAHMSAGSPVFIAGLSMGGFGALRLARLHPGTFAAVSAHSPICEAADFQHFTSDDPMSDTLDPAGPTSIADLYTAPGIPVPPIRFDCGDEDVLRPSVERLASRLKLAGVPHRYEPLMGGHDWEYWSKAFERTLAFFDTVADRCREE